MMRHIILFTLIILTSWLSHAANDIVVDGVVYHWSNSDLGYIVTGWDEETPIQSLHICGTFEDGDVVGIQSGAFQDNTDIVYAKIDEGIIYIGENAFSGCENMKYVVLPEGLVTIEEEAFAFCSSLELFAIPSTVRNIEARAFMGCTSVTDVYFNITDEEALMADPDDPDAFVWWDGWYQNIFGDYQSYDPHGGIEFNRSLLPDAVIHNDYTGEDVTIEHNPDHGTLIHVPAGMYQTYVDSRKLEAWLIEEDDNCYPLWWIVNYGVVGREYTVCDYLTGIYVDVNGDLYAKDDECWLMPDKAYPGEVDYMKNCGLLENHGNIYDQSNWVVLTGLETPEIYKMYRIQGASITGVLRDKHNPVIEVSSTPVKGDQSHYEHNIYITASLMSRTQVVNNGWTFAFVRPKPQEVAYYEWSVYYDNNEFYMPAPDYEQGSNKYAIKGGMIIYDDLYEEPPMPYLYENGYYPFYAISRYKTAEDMEWRLSGPNRAVMTFEPYLESGLTPWYDIYPLLLPDEPIETSVEQIEAGGEDVSHYYDLLGHHRMTPFNGMNIIVTHNGKLTKISKQFIR